MYRTRRRGDLPALTQQLVLLGELKMDMTTIVLIAVLALFLVAYVAKRRARLSKEDVD